MNLEKGSHPQPLKDEPTQVHCCRDEVQPPPKPDYGTTYNTFHNGRTPQKAPYLKLNPNGLNSSPGPFGYEGGKPFDGNTEYRDQYKRKRQKPLQEVKSAPRLFPNTGTTYGPTYLAQPNLPLLNRDPSMKLLAKGPATTYTHFFPPKLTDLRPQFNAPPQFDPKMPFMGSTTYDNHYNEHPIRPRMDKAYDYKNRCTKIRRAKEYL